MYQELNPQFWQAMAGYLAVHPVAFMVKEQTMEPKKVYFIMETERTSDGQFIPCIAVEGEKGYYKTDWAWGTDKNQAQAWADERNQKMGIDRREAAKIQLRTMF